jgi:hypothetical protein
MECAKENVRAARARNAKRYQSYDRARDTRPDRIEMRRRYQQRHSDVVSRNKAAWQARNPLKRQAHVIVGNALRDGKLRPHRCEVCQQCKPVQAAP